MRYLNLLLPLCAAIQLGSTTPNKATPCSNKANNRADWCRYNIHTDYYTVVPHTGVTREYWWVLEDGILSPDGVPRYTQTINGSYPGPTLFADWGDNVIVHVTNKLTQSNNGTSIHFHGIRQQNNSPNDGVPSITQCPVAPNDTITYKWRATQYGTTWYHSHFGLQAWEGLAGGIIINGPASSNYDEDKGVIFLSDWTHPTPDSLFDYAETVGPPTVNNSLINGTNVWSEDGSANQVGSRFTTKFESGTSYRLRLINGAIDTHFKFSIDNHDMTVIASDLVPINPYTTEYIDIGIGMFVRLESAFS
jgi:FtsP/CotA-like multicopper oxidase with cupredoxin domain